MTALIILPDAEAVATDYLLSRSEVVALVDDHVWGELPGLNKSQAEWRFPGARVVRYGGRPALQRPLYLDRALLQFDVWGGTKGQARLAAETCRAVLAEIHLATHTGAVVTDAELGALSFLPDKDFTPARPRYQFDVALTLHP